MTGIEIGYIAAGVGYALIEYWLGRTDKVKSGSVLEVALSGAKSALRVFLAKKPPQV